VGVEIGVWRGDSSALFLARAGYLHLVDAWSPQPYTNMHDYLQRYQHIVRGSTMADFHAHYAMVYAEVCARFKGKPVSIHRCTSREFFANFDETVDWVYIDGSHEYSDVFADLAASAGIVKRGGWIYGDDYGNKTGVMQAVDEFYPDRQLLGLNQYAIPC
jgi:hypothetical protein